MTTQARKLAKNTETADTRIGSQRLASSFIESASLYELKHNTLENHPEAIYRDETCSATNPCWKFKKSAFPGGWHLAGRSAESALDLRYSRRAFIIPSKWQVPEFTGLRVLQLSGT